MYSNSFNDPCFWVSRFIELSRYAFELSLGKHEALRFNLRAWTWGRQICTSSYRLVARAPRPAHHATRTQKFAQQWWCVVHNTILDPYTPPSHSVLHSICATAVTNNAAICKFMIPSQLWSYWSLVDLCCAHCFLVTDFLVKFNFALVCSGNPCFASSNKMFLALIFLRQNTLLTSSRMPLLIDASIQ